MGCVASLDVIDLGEDKELSEYLHEDDIRLVQMSWELLQDDLCKVGVIIFRRYFYFTEYKCSGVVHKLGNPQIQVERSKTSLA